MKKETAVTITEFSVDIANRCTKLIEDISAQAHPSMEEVRSTLGKILGETYFFALPAWQKFPELKPKEVASKQSMQ